MTIKKLGTKTAPGPFDLVALLGRHSWPARRNGSGVLVDLRLFEGPSSSLRLVFRPEGLAAMGVPGSFISEARGSTPPGFVVIYSVDTLPRAPEPAPFSVLRGPHHDHP